MQDACMMLVGISGFVGSKSNWSPNIINHTFAIFASWVQDKVCGYVRFAPKCTGDCEDVFPEYRERNFGVPELDSS
eukprot:scaffold142035_cov24-Prasinocladus_malaysianus.AAC.1